eukprot:12524178-Alexandrium_andersonii.AAC.1
MCIRDRFVRIESRLLANAHPGMDFGELVFAATPGQVRQAAAAVSPKKLEDVFEGGDRGAAKVVVLP